MLGKSRDRPIDVPRVTAVALLLVAAAAGTRARAGLSAKPPGLLAASAGGFAIAVGVAEALAAVACVALLIVVFRGGKRSRKWPDDWHIEGLAPHSRLSRLMALLFVFAALSLPVAALVSHPDAWRTGPVSRQAQSPGGTPAPPTRRPAHPAAAHVPWQLGAVVVGAAAAAAVTFAFASRRGGRGGGEPTLTQTPLAPSVAPLRAALTDAARALGGPGDPRQAIIASYAAMEARLAGAGAAPAAADTPAEVLARATEAGLVRSSAAGTLTGLFRRARYSRHRLGESDRAAAIGALARLRAELGDPQ